MGTDDNYTFDYKHLMYIIDESISCFKISVKYILKSVYKVYFNKKD